MPLVGSGYLTGHEGGTFTYYNVTVAAGSPNVQLTMTCWPDYANNAANIGFVAFGPSGRVINGITTGTAGERRATLSAQVPGIYRVQVYNYIQGLTIQYMLRNQ